MEKKYINYIALGFLTFIGGCDAEPIIKENQRLTAEVLEMTKNIDSLESVKVDLINGTESLQETVVGSFEYQENLKDTLNIITNKIEDLRNYNLQTDSIIDVFTTQNDSIRSVIASLQNNGDSIEWGDVSLRWYLVGTIVTILFFKFFLKGLKKTIKDNNEADMIEDLVGLGIPKKYAVGGVKGGKGGAIGAIILDTIEKLSAK